MVNVTVHGYLIGDPQIKTVGNSDRSVCSFCVSASNGTFDKEAGRYETELYNVNVWGRQADNCAKFLKKSSGVVVSGSLRHRQYAKKDGTTGISVDVQASDVSFAGLRPQKDDDAPAQRQAVPARKQPQFTDITDEEEDLPF